MCLRSISLTAKNLVRQHGPVSSRCAGSNKPPRYSALPDSHQTQPSTVLCSLTASPAESPAAVLTSSEPSSDDSDMSSLPPRVTTRVLKRLPKASRLACAQKFAAILDSVVALNDKSSWDRLLRFPARCLRQPRRGGKKRSLASVVIKQLNEECDLPCSDQIKTTVPKTSSQFATKISEKLEEGDFRGAVRLASSDDMLAPMNEETFNALQRRHPPPSSDSTIPLVSSSESQDGVVVVVEEILKAIHSFPKASAGGPDGLRPRHLQDMISDLNCRQILLPSLAAFVQLALDGNVPPFICPFFFGANLTALTKKSGGVRPIAVGCTLRRLAAKVAGSKVSAEMSDLLSPRQLGCGVPFGAEAAVHAVRLYLNESDPEKAVIKLDFRNAFNSIRRDKVLLAVLNHVPELYPFVHSAYSSPSTLFWADKTIQSEEGVQQGDPLGPLLFCLGIHRLCSSLLSELAVFYLDDGTIGGSVEELTRDLDVVAQMGAEVGLQLNNEKTEILSSDSTTVSFIQPLLPGSAVIDPSRATLLGSPIGGSSSISAVLESKSKMLRRMSDRLQFLPTHDAYLLLRHCFALPKLLYVLRSAPCFTSPLLLEYDNILRLTASAIINIHFVDGDPAWTQATLPVKLGGLGIRSAVQLAPSAYLASAAASSDLVSLIVPAHLQGLTLPFVDIACDLWSLGHESPLPDSEVQCSQKVWDLAKSSTIAESLLDGASDAISRARLLASSAKGSGAWLNVLPITSLGLRMDNNSFRIAVGLRVGAPLCHPHVCQHCGSDVDCFATHGLSCRRSEGRSFRHATLNDIIHRALATAEVPSQLEPYGISRSDGKRPDGITTVPWKSGQHLVWDATVTDTFAPSYLHLATREAGLVAAAAEERKRIKYSNLSASHIFTPVAVETSGVLGPISVHFLKELGHRLTRVTGEVEATARLFQRVAVAVQMGNAASIMGTLGNCPHL